MKSDNLSELTRKWCKVCSSNAHSSVGRIVCVGVGRAEVEERSRRAPAAVAGGGGGGRYPENRYYKNETLPWRRAPPILEPAPRIATRKSFPSSASSSSSSSSSSVASSASLVSSGGSVFNFSTPTRRSGSQSTSYPATVAAPQPSVPFQPSPRTPSSSPFSPTGRPLSASAIVHPPSDPTAASFTITARQSCTVPFSSLYVQVITMVRLVMDW